MTHYSAYKQTYPQSCGAACLLTIAHELKIPVICTFPGSRNDTEFGTPVVALKLSKACEADIYAVTSGNFTTVDFNSDELALQNSGYSKPHNIVRAALALFGLDSEVRENKGLYSKAMNWLYPEVRAELVRDGVEIKNSCPELNSDQLEMKAVAVTGAGIPGGLHWIVCRPDGSCMDPATGQNYDSFATLQKEAPAGKGYLSQRMGLGRVGDLLEKNCFSYQDTGISIVFTKPGVFNGV